MFFTKREHLIDWTEKPNVSISLIIQRVVTLQCQPQCIDPVNKRMYNLSRRVMYHYLGQVVLRSCQRVFTVAGIGDDYLIAA